MLGVPLFLFLSRRRDAWGGWHRGGRQRKKRKKMDDIMGGEGENDDGHEFWEVRCLRRGRRTVGDLFPASPPPPPRFGKEGEKGKKELNKI